MAKIKSNYPKNMNVDSQSLETYSTRMIQLKE